MTDTTPPEPRCSVDLRGARCVVTGGAGTIGSTVVDQLLEAGAGEVVVLDTFVRGRMANLARAQHLAAADAPRRLRVVHGDIRDRALLRELLEPGTDVLFHLAAIRITQCATEPRLALEVLVDGTFDVLEAAVETGVRKVVASSSASVYGLADTFPTPETQHPYHNDTFYGAAKTFNEGMLRSFHAMSGLDYVALRYFNVYGPRMDVHGRYTEVFIRWMERIAAGQPPLIFGDGAQTMDFVYTDDIARANLLAARAPVTDRVYNIASASEVSLRGLADALLAAMDRTDLGVEHGPARDTAGGVTRRLADITAAERDLGWKPELGLEEGLRRLVGWWRETTAAESAAESAAGSAL
ncbi:NAD-dependent epimerase/dehydratase family protein [Peterkaempfera bronchialis]|uniref:NAD-dependent epimerase/dehydratase family protein n=1 Tax=Peterkaempfera bronchialis TaxID=2126346 RepID=UPI003C30CBB1